MMHMLLALALLLEVAIPLTVAGIPEARAWLRNKRERRLEIERQQRLQRAAQHLQADLVRRRYQIGWTFDRRDWRD